MVLIQILICTQIFDECIASRQCLKFYFCSHISGYVLISVFFHIVLESKLRHHLM